MEQSVYGRHLESVFYSNKYQLKKHSVYRDKTTKNVRVQQRHLLLIKLFCSCDPHFNGSSESNVLHSERF